MIDLAALCAEAEVELYDEELVSEGGRRIYRIYITKPAGENGAGKNPPGISGGVSLEECARLSELVSPLLDAHPPVSGEWVLEVSSPGLERPLKKIEHFARSLGERVKIRLQGGESVEGTLLGVEGEELIVKAEAGVEGEAEGEGAERRVKFEELKKARTVFKWS